MIYKIVVDKQPMTNPSEEKKEYEIDIEELRFKRDVYDSLVITLNEDYVMRRLSLSEYNVLTELDPPIKEPLEDVNIELFEGENYIYLYDMTGNRIVAQYLVKNEFNELYVTQSEMDSAITQSAGKIELKVSQKLEGYATKSEMNSAITQKADEIQQQVNDIETLTEVVKGTTSIELDNCANGNLVELHIYGNNSVFKQKYISDSLLIGDTQYVLGDSRLIITNTPSNSTTSTTQTIELGITEVLRQNGKTYDEYILKDNKAQIIRRINADGTIKSTPTTQDLGSFSIVLKEGKNTIKIQNYTADMEAKFVYKNSYTTAFATSVEMNTKITQTAKEINSEVSRKVGNDEVISRINQSADKILLKGNRISIESTKFKLTDKGNITIENSAFTITKNGEKFMQTDGYGLNFYDLFNSDSKGKILGGIHSSYLTSDPSKNGLEFYGGSAKYIRLSLYDESTGKYNSVIQFDNLNDVPYIRNTASGTIFKSNSYKGITVENGLITGWEIPDGLDFEANNIASISGLKIVNGIIQSISWTKS